ncbi:MAG: tRNA (adenosine(37)-N6)-threonylcarbamoyltransferase complex transferase subunit TsaD [Desulfovibrio sp.]|jgi:N6-L-threonylcarbamoyladenine synthase|nr:tRNA (adenosine(37)-N6)-threonylcarbamoyltransferase complex transferase subunit TsaD [Desulfovibrio sp.]
MLCLGIESSCDETAVALVRNGRLLGQQLASQVDVHALFGGVVPEIASREHLRVLPGLYRTLLTETGVQPEEISCVAVSRGPGLLGALLIGLSFAKGLALALGVPLVGVNHLHAHLLAAGLEEDVPFPALGLLVSGGHTHTYAVRSDHNFQLLGRTLDDAAGEAFDKAAKRLNLPYPGGQLLDELGQEGQPDHEMFPRAYIDNDNLDFSFSGLKTAVVNHVNAHPHLALPSLAGTDALAPEIRQELAVVCASFNWSVTETLRIKTERALPRVPNARALIVAGGVAANSMLRRTMLALAEKHGLRAVMPSPSLCTDNAAMVACAGERLARCGRFHSLELEAVPRGRKVPQDWLSAPV